MKNSKYHNILSDYFDAKGQYFNPINWNKCSNRILTELPFQILHSQKPERINSILCNPLFLESLITGDLLKNLIEDVNYSLKYINLKNIVPIKNSIMNSFSAIKNRPLLSIYSIINRLSFQETDIITRDFLNLTIQKLNNERIWLYSLTPFPNVEQTHDIIALNMDKKVYYELNNLNDIVETDFETKKVINIHRSNGNSIKYCIHPRKGKIAFMNKNGEITFENEDTNSKSDQFYHSLEWLKHDKYIISYSMNCDYKFKPWPSCFTWFLNGFIGVNRNCLLVFVDLIKNIEIILSELPILPYSFIEVSQDTKTAIVVSGDRPNNQQILLIKTFDKIPVVDEIVMDDLVVTSACLDETGATLLLATLTRELVLYDIKTNQKKTLSYRTASNIAIRGKIDNCLLSKNHINQIAILTTIDGELLIWNTSKGTIQRKGTFKGLQQQVYIKAISILPEHDKFVLATNETVENLDIEGEEFLVPKTPVNNCCLTQDGWLVTLNEQEKKVSWFYHNKHVSDFINNAIQPYSVVSFGENGTVVVGCKNGTVIKLSPNITPIVDDAIDLFEGPIVSVINWGEGRILAVSKNAQIKITDFESNPHVKEIRHIDIIREEQMACRLGETEDIVLCGRSHAGDSLWSVYVIRANDRREKVFESKEIVSSLSSSEDGKNIYAIINGSISCYTKSSNKDWRLFSNRNVQAKHLVCCLKDFLAVVLEEKGLYWLELWDNAVDMKTITAVDLPFRATCIFSLFNLIAIGTEDGKHVIFKIQA